MVGLFFHKNKNSIVFVLLLSLSLALISMRSSEFSNKMTDGFLAVTQPFAWVIKNTENVLSSTWDNLLNLESNLAEIEKFKKERGQEQINQLVREKEELSNEIIRLRKILSIKEIRSTLPFEDAYLDAVNADVIMRDPQTNYQTLIIDKGYYHDIEVNMPVVAYQTVKKRNGEETLERVVVGKIGQVTYSASKIVPIIDSQCQIHVKIRGSAYTGLLQGRGLYSKGLMLNHLDKKANFSIGDEILTSGGQSLFPKGIKVGQILEDASAKSSFMKSALVEPYVDFTRLESVFVIKKKLSDDLKLLLGDPISTKSKGQMK